MKKLLTCTIAALIGLTLFACSGDTTPPTTDPESQPKTEQTQAPATEPSVTEPEEVLLTEFEQKVLGEWKHAPEAEPRIVVREDRTMSIDGVEYTWRAQEYGEYVFVYAFLGEEPKYGEEKYAMTYQETDAFAYAQIVERGISGAITTVHYFRQEAFSHLPDYYGEYYPKYESYSDKDIDYASPYMVIGKDGTLTVENEQYEFYYCYPALGSYFPIQKDGKDVGSFNLRDTDGEEYFSLGISDLAVTRFVRSPDCERITITADNWKDYFEAAPDVLVQKNAFGEPNYATFRYLFDLKPEFKEKALEIDCAVEFSVDEDEYDRGTFTYNIDTDEFKIEITAEGNGITDPSRLKDPISLVSNMSYVSSGIAIFYYRLEISDDKKTARLENAEIYRSDSWELLRIQGYIMLDK